MRSPFFQYNIIRYYRDYGLLYTYNSDKIVFTIKGELVYADKIHVIFIYNNPYNDKELRNNEFIFNEYLLKEITEGK